jgi:hypothetical protein
MVTALSIAVAALLLMVVFFATWVFNLRARTFSQAEEIRRLRSTPKTPAAPPPSSGDDTKRQKEKAPSTIADYDDNMEIPAALIGARCKEIIEQLAPIFKMTPVNLLREAIAVGLTGGRPVTEEMLDFIEKERKAMGLPPPSKPGPVDMN